MKDSLQGPGGRGRIRRPSYRAHDRDTARARAHDVGNIRSVNAADGHPWPVQSRGNGRDERQSHRRVIRFRRRRKDGTNAEVVSPFPLRRQRLLQTMGGPADDPAVTEDAPGHDRRQVVLSQMHAVGVNGRSHVGMVVDDERNGMVARDLAQEAGLGAQVAGVGRFVAQLQDVRPAGDGGLGQEGQITSAGGGAVEDDVQAPIVAGGVVQWHRRETASARRHPRLAGKVA